MTLTPETTITIDLRIDDVRTLDRIAEVAIDTDQSICDDVGEVFPLLVREDLMAFLRNRSAGAQGLKFLRFDNHRIKTGELIGVLRDLGLAYEVAVTSADEELRRYWMPGFENEIRVRLIDEEVVHTTKEIDGIMTRGQEAWQNFRNDLATALSHRFSVEVPFDVLKPTGPAPRP